MSFKTVHKKLGIPWWIYELESTNCWRCGQQVHISEFSAEVETGVLESQGAWTHYCPDGGVAEIGFDESDTIPKEIGIVVCSFKDCDAARPLSGKDDWYPGGKSFAIKTSRDKKREPCPNHRTKDGERKRK